MAPNTVRDPNKPTPGIKKTIVRKKPAKPAQVNRDKFIMLRCPICFKYFGKDSVSATKCGHVFCTLCLKTSLRRRAQCPICMTSLRCPNDHHTLHLDMLVDDDDTTK